ncbi:hypothetical protein IU501_11520 [Nocardia otitidiscaviarum]|uniref:hypothetical protein n=1 Tax=Nocardia otitidiscaviarum TaxID=1823 RepID=UPI0004A6CA0C|nr:hypothetical protein [Nocardia otitidiscaviarum]MBF6133628.1 hypothetical protein [Nocardia otitidiscaviarum]MBF6487656.1 hypothetical protein [Nocardia otitidiscaviarum]
MRAADLEIAFRRYLESHGRALDDLDAATAIDAMTTFYAHHRVTDVDLDSDGDMLLFQWGIYGEGQQEFVYDITRQVITDDGDDDNIRQLSLTLHYPMTPSSPSIGNGSQWCSHPEQTEHFLSLVAHHPATSHVLTAHPHRAEVTFDHAG